MSKLNPEKWVSLYGDYLYSLAFLKTSHKESAEDLVHETFIAALKGQAQFLGKSSEKTWLTQILKNKIVDYYRKMAVERKTEEELRLEDENFYSHFFQVDNYSSAHWNKIGMPAKWNERSDALIEKQEFDRMIEACLGKLPPNMRPVFISKYIDEEDSKQICKDFDLTSSHYWVILHRAKLAMRACLEKQIL